VADKKIPLLTDVYQPKAALATGAQAESKQVRLDDSAFITPELIARVIAHIKPRLEADITKTVAESLHEVLKSDLIKALQDEIVTTQATIESRTVDFVDKTKADLKTELPRMYQNSADLVFNNLSENISALQIDATSKFDATLTEVIQASVEAASVQINSHVETLQTDISARIANDLNQEMQAFQAQALDSHQALLGKELNQVFQSISQSAKADLQQQLDAMQAEALIQMRATFNEAMPSIYTSAVAEQQEAMTTEIGERLTQEMDAFQVKSLSEHQTQLSELMTTTLHALNQNAKQELQQQMSLNQAEILAQMRTTFSEAIPSIYAAAAEEMKAKFADEMTVQTMQVRDNFLSTVNADLPAVQEVMRENIQQVLATALPTLENDLRRQLTTELQDLLLKVKFVLPK
jgi:uncharacterized protein (DUF2267 family)